MKVSELAAKYSCRHLLTDKGARKLFCQLAAFGCGFIASGGSIFGTYAPFGVSVTAAVPFSGIVSSLVGSLVGYVVLGGGLHHFRYIAAMLAVLAIRWTLNDIRQLTRYSLYAAAVCFVPSLATGLASMSVSGFTPEGTMTAVLESLLGAAAAYFFSRTATILRGTRSLGMLLPQETACLVLSGCIGLLALSPISLGTLSLGRIAAILCILFAARYGGTAGGTIAGIAAGIVLGLASEDYFFLGSAYAFGGLMAGLFCRTGRIAAAVAFLISSTIVSLQSGEVSSVLTVFMEASVTGLIFVLLPKSTGSYLSAVFAPSGTDAQCEGLRRSMILRLDFASKALSDISSDIEEVAQKLSEIVTPTLDSVYQKAVDATCCRCGLRVYCWEHRDGISMEALQSANDRLLRNGSINSEDFREEFRQKCCRSTEMASAINQCYKNFLASEAAAKRIESVRTVVSGQFCGLGDILSEMAEEYENYEFFDNDLSDRIYMKCKELGLMPSDVSCRIDHLGRMTVEAEILEEDRKKIKRSLLVRELSRVCGRHFDTPGITAAMGRCRITLCERPAFEVEIASSQHVCGSGVLCGDHLRHFRDGSGRMIAVLSDGMGTGGRAAVDGGMAASIMTKLLKAGLGFDSSLKAVNAALLVKSEDESLATLDVVSVDLYTGQTDFMKAGAAVSFLRKKGEMYRVETPSLPVGILPEVEFTYTEDTLQPGDLIVMVSDGAIACGEEWIEHIIMQWEEKSMQALADTINDEATAKRNDGHDDDITVIAMRIKSR